MAFERQVERRVQQRVAGADKSRQGLALQCDEGFFEGYAFVARQYWLTNADEAVAVTDRGWHMRDLIAARLPLAGRPSELLKGFEKERLDVVRLQAAGLGAFHLLAYTGHAARVHGVMRQGTLFKQGLELRTIHRIGNRLGEFGAYLGALAVANRLQQQVAERPALELEFAEYIEHLATESLAGLLELVE